jgi:Na+-driven multidrug efflux pump
MDRTQAMRYQKINSLLWSFSLPAIVGMVVNSLYNIVDRIFLGRGIGSLAIAATTVAFPIMIILMAVSVLIGVGATALISIRLGEQRQEEAEKVIGTATTMIILLPTIFAFIFFLYTEPILIAFGSSSFVMGIAQHLLGIIEHILRADDTFQFSDNRFSYPVIFHWSSCYWIEIIFP